MTPYGGEALALRPARVAREVVEGDHGEFLVALSVSTSNVSFEGPDDRMVEAVHASCSNSVDDSTAAGGTLDHLTLRRPRASPRGA
jgi:hypothetical protein